MAVGGGVCSGLLWWCCVAVGAGSEYLLWFSVVVTGILVLITSVLPSYNIGRTLSLLRLSCIPSTIWSTYAVPPRGCTPLRADLVQTLGPEGAALKR